MPKKMEKQINKNFEIICDSFLDNKLGIHFGGIKFILFASKHKIKSSGKLNVRYKNIKIRQHSQVNILVLFQKHCLGNLWFPSIEQD